MECFHSFFQDCTLRIFSESAIPTSQSKVSFAAAAADDAAADYFGGENSTAVRIQNFNNLYVHSNAGKSAVSTHNH